MTGIDVRLPVRDRKVLVIGAHTDTLPWVSHLLDDGALVRVVGESPTDAIHDLAERGLIDLETRRAVEADVAQSDLVVDTDGRPDLAEIAVTQGKFCVTGDRTESCAASGTGEVVLVGGGPGPEGLLTTAGLAELRAADVIVVDRLAPLGAMSLARPDAVIVDVSKIPRGRFTPQEEINRILVEHAGAGRRVVRLKGGDGFVFGRGGEEWQACAAAGVPVRVIPGVSASIGVPALAGIPVTHRSLTQGFVVVSGHAAPGDPRSTIDWSALARANVTIVLMMAVATLRPICAALVDAGLDPDTPAATIANGGMPSQRVARGTVADLADIVDTMGIGAPAVTVIGAVAGFAADAS